jgi:hypothetical protein
VIVGQKDIINGRKSMKKKIKKLLLKLVDVIEHLLLRLMGWK